MSEWRTPEVDDLCDAVVALRSRDEAAAFLRDVCTLHELEVLAHRWHAAQLLDRGIPYAEVAAHRARLDRHRHARRPLAAPRRGRLPARARPPRPLDEAAVTRPFRLALPSKGRLHEPALELARAAGVEVDVNGRALHAHCSRWDIEVLFARADDIPAWTADGAVDAAVAGRDQIVESGADVDELVRARVRALRARGGRAGRRAHRRRLGARRRPGRDLPPADRGGLLRRRGPGASRPSPSAARSSSRRGWTRPTASSISSRAATRCARTACARSRRCSSRRRRWSPAAASTAAPSARRRRARHGDRERRRRPRQALPDAERAGRLARRRDRRSCPGMDSPTVLPLARGGLHAVHAVVDADAVSDLLAPLRAAGRPLAARAPDPEPHPMNARTGSDPDVARLPIRPDLLDAEPYHWEEGLPEGAPAPLRHEPLAGAAGLVRPGRRGARPGGRQQLPRRHLLGLRDAIAEHAGFDPECVVLDRRRRRGGAAVRAPRAPARRRGVRAPPVLLLVRERHPAGRGRRSCTSPSPAVRLWWSCVPAQPDRRRRDRGRPRASATASS